MKNKKLQQYISKEDNNSFSINLFDLNEITQIVYGTAIEMGLVEKNSTFGLSVDGKLTPQEEQYVIEAKTNEVMEASKYYALMNDMCKKGYIDKGKYSIKAFW